MKRYSLADIRIGLENIRSDDFGDEKIGPVKIDKIKKTNFDDINIKRKNLQKTEEMILIFI